MYIAVVADNIAERKQTERLLGRANQALASEIGTLYIDSYGDEDAFLHACMRYEMFIIDYDHDYKHSLLVAEKLKQTNLSAQIAICKYEEDPFLHEFAENNLFTIDKPIRTAPLHQLIREIFAVLEKKKKSETIVEIRGEVGTKYVNKDEIVFIEVFDKQHKLIFHFQNDSPFPVVGTLDDLVKLLGDYSEFRMVNKNTAINDNFVLVEDKKQITLAGGYKIKLPSALKRLFHHTS